MYHRIHPLYANDEHIYLYVNCLDGPKKGQWLLQLHTENGNLYKAIKLNKNDNEVVLISELEVLGGAEDMALAGVKYPAASVDLKNGRFSMNYQTSKALNLFFMQLDSSGEVKTRLENFIPAPNDLLKEKELKEFLFRNNALTRTDDGFDLNYECLYKGKDGIFRTYGFLVTHLIPTPDGPYKPENNAFLPCYRNEKKNPHSKLTANQYDNDKPAEADRLFYKEPFVRNYTDAHMNFTTVKKTTSVISYFENKKTNSLECYKNIMKNYVWETVPLKIIADHERCKAFLTHNGKFILFYNTGNEASYTLFFTEP